MERETFMTGERFKTRDFGNVFRLIYSEKQCTRQQISAKLGISLPTVTHNLNLLEESGLIYNAGAQQATGGRKAICSSALPTPALLWVLILQGITCPLFWSIWTGYSLQKRDFAVHLKTLTHILKICEMRSNSFYQRVRQIPENFWGSAYLCLLSSTEIRNLFLMQQSSIYQATYMNAWLPTFLIHSCYLMTPIPPDLQKAGFPIPARP